MAVMIFTATSLIWGGKDSKTVQDTHLVASLSGTELLDASFLQTEMSGEHLLLDHSIFKIMSFQAFFFFFHTSL